MKGGYVKIYRRLFDHEVFDSFVEAAMFVDFIARAAWADTTVSYKGRCLTLARGQFSMSLRDMADRYNTSVGSIRRRLVKWEKHNLIKLAGAGAGGHGVNVVTVCNYDKYQFAEQRHGGSTSYMGPTVSPATRSPLAAPAETPGLCHTDQAGERPPERGPARGYDRSDRIPAAHLCPEDFAPNDANKAYAKECGFSRADFDAMVADMKDWSRAAPGRKGQRNDWQAMFRRWMRREVQARAPNVVSLHGGQATGRQI